MSQPVIITVKESKTELQKLKKKSASHLVPKIKPKSSIKTSFSNDGH